MTPEKEAELFAQLNLLLEIQRRSEADLREVKAEMRDIKADIRDIRTEMRQSQALGQDTNSRVARLEGRVEEQSKFLQLVLASRQSRRAAGA